jgi:hypothetical protein
MVTHTSVRLHADSRDWTSVNETMTDQTSSAKCYTRNRGDAASFFADFAEDAVSAEVEGTIFRSRAEMIAAQETMFGTVLKGPGWCENLTTGHLTTNRRPVSDPT